MRLPSLAGIISGDEAVVRLWLYLHWKEILLSAPGLAALLWLVLIHTNGRTFGF